jgi:hypothetical protein
LICAGNRPKKKDEKGAENRLSADNRPKAEKGAENELRADS